MIETKERMGTRKTIGREDQQGHSEEEAEVNMGRREWINRGWGWVAVARDHRLPQFTCSDLRVLELQIHVTKPGLCLMRKQTWLGQVTVLHEPLGL